MLPWIVFPVDDLCQSGTVMDIGNVPVERSQERERYTNRRIQYSFDLKEYRHILFYTRLRRTHRANFASTVLVIAYLHCATENEEGLQRIQHTNPSLKSLLLSGDSRAGRLPLDSSSLVLLLFIDITKSNKIRTNIYIVVNVKHNFNIPEHKVSPSRVINNVYVLWIFRLLQGHLKKVDCVDSKLFSSPNV